MISSGHLRSRCSFLKPVEVSDGGGGNTLTWPVQFTIRAGFTFPNLRQRLEGVVAGSIESTQRGELVVRDSKSTRLIDKTWLVNEETDLTLNPATATIWNIRKVHPRKHDGWIRMEVESGAAI